MALTEQEKQIIQYGKENNKSLPEVKAALLQYRNSQKASAQIQQMAQDPSAGEKFMKGAENVLGTVFGGQKIGEAIGTQIAKATADDPSLVSDGPTPTQIAGDVVRTGVTFFPIGKVAGFASKGLSAIGLKKGVETAGKVIAGGTAGATADVAVGLSEGESPELGLGTYLGVGIPAASPVLGAIGRATNRVAGRITTETTGILTGTSQETIEQAFKSARAGGDELERFTQSLRGQRTPEQLVNNVRESVDVVQTSRNAIFKETLAELGDITVPTQPAKTRFTEALNKFKVTIDDNGTLNFTNSELRTVPAAQNKLTQAWREISSMPDNMSLEQIDTTRQAVKAIKSIAGDDPSSNKANALIDEAVRSVREAGEQVEGYGQMLDNFGETSEFLNELNRGLSTGDRATIDQAYRRLATTLKTNNEQRKALLTELDDATGGTLLSDIAGQQLSELYPRGLFRQILAGGATVSAASGALTPALLPSLILASPRVVGEFARSLGISANKVDGFIEAVDAARTLLIKAGVIGGAEMGI